jgi:hypothetical protein
VRMSRRIICFGWISLSLLSLCEPCLAGKESFEGEVCRAIFKAEGGDKAQFAYGIRGKFESSCNVSLPAYKGKDYCRKVCEQTVEHAILDWQEEGDFLEFLGSRYCPVSGRLSKAEMALNWSWVENVRYFMNKGKKRL